MRGTERRVVHHEAQLNRRFCPAWCVTGHDSTLGEDDWLHTSEPLPLADGVLARLVMSIDPDTSEADGPYVMIGSTEYTVREAASLARSLLALVAVDGEAEDAASQTRLPQQTSAARNLTGATG